MQDHVTHTILYVRDMFCARKAKLLHTHAALLGWFWWSKETTTAPVNVSASRQHGFLVPDLSWFEIIVLQRNEADVVALCERLARENANDMVREHL
jgi:hypothetical protein